MSIEQEEENLGRYESQDHRQESRDGQPKGWEFKILRTNGNGFRHPQALKQVCTEEAESGWILLEKLDDCRLRFRRPLMARENDHLSPIDPYRSYYGMSSELGAAISITVLLIVLTIPTYLGFAFMQNIFKSISTQKIPLAPKLVAPKLAPAPNPSIQSPKPKA